ncbi:hypothetical protein [Desulfonatronovibrio hydrogenovorans]|uniref:hypothetical protein n=1 Tax=Desulfonatronovibrio hydrogenovorans TaxID=53245 RepID=UPI000490F0CD|nr:hypothetical protein [Desulfonatronovibrio hydrogenovorans]
MARKLTKLEKFGLIAAVITGMLFFYLKNVYDPQQASLERSRDQLNRTIRDYNQLQAIEPLFQLRQTLESRRQELVGLEEEMAGLDIRPGLAEELIRTQHHLYRQLESRNLRITNSASLGEKTLRDFTWQVFRLNLEGGYSGFLEFLSELREYPYPTQVHRVHINGEGAGWPLKISLEIWVMK